MGWLGGGWSPGDRIVSTAPRRHGAVRAATGSLGKHRRRLWLTMVSAEGGFRAGASRTGSKLESSGRTPRAELARRPHAAELCAHRLASRRLSPALHPASYALCTLDRACSALFIVRTHASEHGSSLEPVSRREADPSSPLALGNLLLCYSILSRLDNALVEQTGLLYLLRATIGFLLCSSDPHDPYEILFAPTSAASTTHGAAPSLARTSRPLPHPLPPYAGFGMPSSLLDLLRLAWISRARAQVSYCAASPARWPKEFRTACKGRATMHKKGYSMGQERYNKRIESGSRNQGPNGRRCDVGAGIPFGKRGKRSSNGGRLVDSRFLVVETCAL